MGLHDPLRLRWKKNMAAPVISTPQGSSLAPWESDERRGASGVSWIPSDQVEVARDDILNTVCNSRYNSPLYYKYTYIYIYVHVVIINEHVYIHIYHDIMRLIHMIPTFVNLRVHHIEQNHWSGRALRSHALHGKARRPESLQRVSVSCFVAGVT